MPFGLLFNWITNMGSKWNLSPLESNLHTVLFDQLPFRPVLIKPNHVYKSSEDPVKNAGSDSVGLWWGINFCISSKLLGYINAFYFILQVTLQIKNL